MCIRDRRKDKEKEERNKLFHKVTLDNLFDSIQQGEMKELNIIVKADEMCIRDSILCGKHLSQDDHRHVRRQCGIQ